MNETPTRDEFEALVGCVIEGGHADFDATMAVYDAQVKCIAELKAEVVRLTDSVDTLEDEVLSLEETLLDYEQDNAQEYAT